jgi:hypothetical protein
MIEQTLDAAWNAGTSGQALVRFVAGANSAPYSVANVAEVCSKCDFGDMPQSDFPMAEGVITNLVADNGAAVFKTYEGQGYYTFSCQEQAGQYLATKDVPVEPIMRPITARPMRFIMAPQ